MNAFALTTADHPAALVAFAGGTSANVVVTVG